MCVGRHTQSTQNKKFAHLWNIFKKRDCLPVDKHKFSTSIPKITSLQYLCNLSKKPMKDEVDFLHTDKRESFLQIDTMIFDGDRQTFPKFPK